MMPTEDDYLAFERMPLEELQIRHADVRRKIRSGRYDCPIQELLVLQSQIELAMAGKQQEPSLLEAIEAFETSVERFVSNRIRAARGLARVRQDELARLTGLSLTQISRIEKGVRRLSVAELIRIAIALRQPIAFFTYPARDPEIIGTGWEAATA